MGIMRIKAMDILGGKDAKEELDNLANKGYTVDENYGYTGGYYQQDNKVWISWWAGEKEVFVEDFDNKPDAVFYAMGIPCELSDGTWK